MNYPDETLNHWADVYVARNLRDFGITLDQLLARPHQTLARVDRKMSARAFMALRRRHAGIDPCEGYDPATQIRGGRLTEKMHQNAPSHRPTAFASRAFHHIFRSAPR